MPSARRGESHGDEFGSNGGTMKRSKREVRRDAIRICRQLRKRQTNAERILWERVRDRQFLNLKFFRQYPFFHEQDGSLRFYVADFFCRERKAVVELDGPPHNVTVEDDTERTEILSALSVRVVRFKN